MKHNTDSASFGKYVCALIARVLDCVSFPPGEAHSLGTAPFELDRVHVVAPLERRDIVQITLPFEPL